MGKEIAFVPPETVQECDERIAELTAATTRILVQLRDPLLRETTDRHEYAVWRSRASKARAFKIGELAHLKAWKAQWDRERQAAAAAAKAASAARAAEQHQATIASLPEVDKIVSELYRGLARLYRTSGLPVTERDRKAFEHAHAYLIERGIFE